MTTEMGDVDFQEQGVIFITAEDRPAFTEWTNPAIEILLKELKRQMELFMRRKIISKRQIFDNSSIRLSKKGFNYTSAQCENKWKSLKRRYMSKYKKLLTGQLVRKTAFEEEITAILATEKPSFKQETDEISKVNLNIPPGFAQKNLQDEDMEEGPEQYSDTEEQGYSTSDERLVEMVLQGSNSTDELKTSKQHSNMLLPEHDTTQQSSDEQPYMTQNSNTEQSKLIREMRELRKNIKRSMDQNTELMKTNNATHEQILISLDSLDKREEDKMEIKRLKLEKQSELLQQIKIQNSLIAKLIQKIGNGDSNR